MTQDNQNQKTETGKTTETAPTPDPYEPKEKEWTIMFYFASDNPLAPTIVSQLKAIKDAGYHPDANVIAQFDPHTVNTPAHTFDVNIVNKLRAPGESRIGFGTNDPYVRNLVLDKLWGEKEEKIRERLKKYVETSADGRRDSPIVESTPNEKATTAREPSIIYDPARPPAEMSGEQDPKEALSSFLNFCRESYPARHYLLFILGHGLVVGNDSFLFDDHAVKHSLLLTELGEVLRNFNCDIHQDEQPGELEMVAFHSCSMSSLEVAYELKGSAKYMLASQGPAFVGSWPYRHLLIRLFNDLNSYKIDAGDLESEDQLASRLKAANDPLSKHLSDRFSNKTKELLAQHKDSTYPSRPLLSALIREFNLLLEDPQLPDNALFKGPELSEETKRRLAQPLRGLDAKWLNRMLLGDVCLKLKKRDQPDLKEILTRIFYYCIYNSFDFQLAGYSFDLCLCDLNKVSQITMPLKTLSDTLTKRLTEPVVKQLVLLAHWDSQSFWQEDYADMYDFCFRLQRRCEEFAGLPKKPSKTEICQTLAGFPVLKEIWDACESVTATLQRGSEDLPDQLIVRSAFAGPAFQYSHGLSIFFPWAAPVGSNLWDEQYPKYKLQKKTSWGSFLKAYFDLTMRETHAEEDDPKEYKAPLDSISRELLGLLEDIGAQVFNDEGQLGKYGPDDPLVKYGPDDPAGAGSCVCPTIKNYPLITGRRTKGRVEPGEKSDFPVSPNFAEQIE